MSTQFPNSNTRRSEPQLDAYADQCRIKAKAEVSAATRMGERDFVSVDQPDTRRLLIETQIHYGIVVKHTHEERKGRHKPTAADISVNAEVDYKQHIVRIKQEEVERLENAAALIAKVKNVDFKPFSEIGQFRQHPARVYFNYSCNTCNGNGNVSCAGCTGGGRVTCHSCGGRHSWPCLMCLSSGQVRNPNNNSVGPCWSCYNGIVTCQACDRDGEIQCRRCSGTGENQCQNCDGHCSLTDVGSVEVHATKSHQFKPASGDLGKLLPIYRKVHDLKHLAEIAISDLVSASADHKGVTCTYQAKVLACHQTFKTSGVTTGWLMYADPPIVLDAGNMVSTLLEGDAKALLTGDEGAIATFMESEVNQKILLLDGKGLKHEAIADGLGRLVDTDYVDKALLNISSSVDSWRNTVFATGLLTAAILVWPLMYCVTALLVLWRHIAGPDSVQFLLFITFKREGDFDSFLVSYFGLSAASSVFCFAVAVALASLLWIEFKKNSFFKRLRSPALADWAKEKGHSIGPIHYCGILFVTWLIAYLGAELLPFVVKNGNLLGIIPFHF